MRAPSFQQRYDKHTTRSYRSRKATASPFPQSAMYWCNSNASAVLETRVSSYLSVTGEATPSGGHKDPKRVVPPAPGGWELNRLRRLKKAGIGVLPGCQNCRLNMTRAPQVKLRDCNSPLPSPSSSMAGPPHRNPHTERQTLELVR